MARQGGIVNRIVEAAEQYTGYRLEQSDHVELLEAESRDARMLRRELHDLAYTVLDYQGGNPQEVKATERRKWAQKSRVAWMNDPLAGAAVDLLNDFVFGRGVPKPRAKDPKVQEVIDEAWCHDEATEALTNEGWMSVDALQARWEAGTVPQVAAWQDGAIVYETPKGMNVTSYDGEMLRFETQQMDMLVTPNHRMLVRGQTGTTQVKLAEQVKSGGWRVPASAPACGVEVEKFVLPGVLVRERRRALAGVPPTKSYSKAERQPLELEMDSWLNWLGWWLAEGHASATGRRPSWSVYVCQSEKSPLLGKLRAACDALGIAGDEYVTPAGKWLWRPRKPKQLGRWLRENCLTADGEKCIPEFVFALSARQQALVLDGLLAGDGNYSRIMEKGNGAFYSSDYTLAHDAQRLAVNSGWKATLSSRQRRGIRREWTLRLSRRAESWLPKPSSHDYQGRVWCFSMTSGTMVTRRNGKVAFSGNTDPDNQLVLTSYDAQLALGVDLQLQSNLFVLVFDEGEDGKVKLGLLDHDTVEDVVRDEQNRMRVLYYKARRREQKWDWENDAPAVSTPSAQVKGGDTVYYAHWRNVEAAEEEGETPDGPKADKLGKGRVYHIAVNRTSEQVFGVPTMQRTLRWFNAFNEFMNARVDQTRAAAAFTMKRKVKGTKGQVEKMATEALARSSLVGSATAPDGAQLGPTRPASIITENDLVSFEDFSLNTNAGNAQQDSQMLRGQVSAATHWPQHYLGDAASANLATATSLELPVLKYVEGRQEIMEQLFRFFIDRVIERAREAGRLSDDLTEEEYQERLKRQGREAQQESPDGAMPGPEQFQLAAAGENPADLRSAVDKERARDFSYDFGLPSPLRRMMGDLITAVMNIAKTFDPNGTNMELSRQLLAIALGEGLELEDPAAAVEAIFPPGYVDPAIAAMQAQSGGEEAAQGRGEPSPFETTAPDGQTVYGAPAAAQTPEETGIKEGLFADLPEDYRDNAEKRVVDTLDNWDELTDDIISALH